LPDPRRQELCTYAAAHLWWHILLSFLLRRGSRNRFDTARNSGWMPANVLRLCGQPWDEQRLGPRRTVSCSENAKRHAGRVSVEAVAELPLHMVQRLFQMRMLESARLFGSWWMILIDGTLKDRGHRCKNGGKRYRYVLDAKLVGPNGLTLHLMSEFSNLRDPALEKEDCELNAFHRLSARLRQRFPRLSICLLMDGLYAVRPVFDTCKRYGWKYLITLKDGRQPLAWSEAVQRLYECGGRAVICRRRAEHGPVEQTLRWVEGVDFGEHSLNVLFMSEIGPAATLWCWVSNLSMSADRVAAIANEAGRARQNIENTFNVEKNGGFGLEHAFCANETAAQNYHLLMQVAYTLWQLLAGGLFGRLMRGCRKMTERSMAELLHVSLLTVPLPVTCPAIGQLRFEPSS
jgi:hypothetical protein